MKSLLSNPTYRNRYINPGTRVLLDLNHPSHFHFFREFILTVRKKKVILYITIRNRKYLAELLEADDIPYILKGGRSKTLAGKFLILFRDVFRLFWLAWQVKPDVFLSFASPYAAIAGKLAGRPVITFDDTECDRLLHLIYPRFTDLILTPECFQKSFGPKHVRFKGYKESAYLSEYNLIRSPGLKASLGLNKNEPYILVRFVAHRATHEFGRQKLSDSLKIKIVRFLNQYHKVLISSESELPAALRQYEPDIPVHWMHQVLEEATLFFGESATMAAEAALLGTPAIFIENTGRGFTDALEINTGILNRFTVNRLNQALDRAAEQLTARQIDPDDGPGSNPSTPYPTTRILYLLSWLIEDPVRNIRYLIKHPKHIRHYRAR